METTKTIITKSNQRFEVFSSLEEALTAIKNREDEGYCTTLIIEYENGKEYIRDGSITEGEYCETGIKTLLFNPERGVIQMYGDYRITDIDNNEEYTKERDTLNKIWNASASFHYIYPAFQIAAYI